MTLAGLWHGDPTPTVQGGLRKEAGRARGLAGARSREGQPLFVVLPRKFSLDDLLTIIMIYWTTGTITSSQRFYKENMGHSFLSDRHQR